jgi:hypothetical protein
MSEDECDVTVRINKCVVDIAESLTKIEVGGTEFIAYPKSGVLREALIRGLRLMTIERHVLKRLSEQYTAEMAKKLYASLLKTAEAAGETAGSKGEAPAEELRK